MRILLVAVGAVLLQFGDATPACACSPDRTWFARAHMMSDLRNVASLQADYAREHGGRYASGLKVLATDESGQISFKTDSGTRIVITRGDEHGWLARATVEGIAEGCWAGAGSYLPTSVDGTDVVGAGGVACDLHPGHREAITINRALIGILGAATLLLAGVVMLGWASPWILLPGVTMLLIAFRSGWWTPPPMPCDQIGPFTTTFAVVAVVLLLYTLVRSRLRTAFR